MAKRRSTSAITAFKLMLDYSKLTLGELLSSKKETIRRNAIAILKQLQTHCSNCNEKPKTLIHTLNGLAFCEDCWNTDIDL